MIDNIKNIIFKTVKHELFWIMLFCFSIRHIIYQYSHILFYNTDTVTYHYAAQNIFKGIIDGARTPIYPMLIKLFEWIWPEPPFQKLVYFQHLVSYISIIPFFLVCKRWMSSKLLIVVATILWGCYSPVIYFNNGLFAESILISSLVWLIWLYSIFLSKPTALKAIAINIFLFYLVMLKPASLVYYGIFGVIWGVGFIFNKYGNLVKPIAISFIVSITLLVDYCALNKVQNNYWGLTTVSHDNLFINVIFSGAYRTIPDEKFITAVDNLTQEKDHYYTVFYLNNEHDRYQKAYSDFPLEFMSHFDMRDPYLMPTSTLGYTRDNVAKYLKQAMVTNEFLAYTINKPARFLEFNLFNLKGKTIYMLLLVELALILVGLYKRVHLNGMRLFYSQMIAGILITFFIAGVSDGTYGRVLLPLAPFLVLMFFFLVDSALNYVRVINPFTKAKIIDKPDGAPDMWHRLINSNF